LEGGEDREERQHHLGWVAWAMSDKIQLQWWVKIAQLSTKDRAKKGGVSLLI
jgi:hypothetical protein